MARNLASSAGLPDGAMIPSMIAQAMQTLFRFREVTNPKRPLSSDLDNELLREFLRSGDLVATTFYGPVRFNQYGQNVGRDASTLQVHGGLARVVLPGHLQQIGTAHVFSYPAPAFADCPEDAHEHTFIEDDCLLCAASTCVISSSADHLADSLVSFILGGSSVVALLAILARLVYRHHQHFFMEQAFKQVANSFYNLVYIVLRGSNREMRHIVVSTIHSITNQQAQAKT